MSCTRPAFGEPMRWEISYSFIITFVNPAGAA
jgi:hypothetical protein